MHVTRRGFTLFEMVVVIGAFSLLTLTLTQLLVGGMNAYRKGKVQTDLKSEARVAIDAISADFRQYNGSSASFDPFVGDFVTKSNTIQVTRSIDNDKNHDVSIRYTINPTTGQLIRYNQNAGTRTVIAENVDPTKSYFQWYNPNDQDLTRNNSTMIIKLSMLEDFEHYAANPNRTPQKMSVETKVSTRQTSSSDSTTALIVGGVVTPASLDFPGGFLRRNK